MGITRAQTIGTTYLQLQSDGGNLHYANNTRLFKVSVARASVLAVFIVALPSFILTLRDTGVAGSSNLAALPSLTPVPKLDLIRPVAKNREVPFRFGTKQVQENTNSALWHSAVAREHEQKRLSGAYGAGTEKGEAKSYQYGAKILEVVDPFYGVGTHTTAKQHERNRKEGARGLRARQLQANVYQYGAKILQDIDPFYGKGTYTRAREDERNWHKIAYGLGATEVQATAYQYGAKVLEEIDPFYGMGAYSTAKQTLRTQRKGANGVGAQRFQANSYWHGAKVLEDIDPFYGTGAYATAKQRERHRQKGAHGLQTKHVQSKAYYNGAKILEEVDPFYGMGSLAVTKRNERNQLNKHYGAENREAGFTAQHNEGRWQPQAFGAKILEEIDPFYALGTHDVAKHDERERLKKAYGAQDRENGFDGLGTKQVLNTTNYSAAAVDERKRHNGSYAVGAAQIHGAKILEHLDPFYALGATDVAKHDERERLKKAYGSKDRENGFDGLRTKQVQKNVNGSMARVIERYRQNGSYAVGAAQIHGAKILEDLDPFYALGTHDVAKHDERERLKTSYSAQDRENGFDGLGTQQVQDNTNYTVAPADLATILEEIDALHHDKT